MRRTQLVLAVASAMVMMLALTAGPARRLLSHRRGMVLEQGIAACPTYWALGA